MLWILVQIDHITTHAVNAVNLSANRSPTQTHALNTVDAANTVNISANRSYNPPCSEHCEFGYRVVGTLWILVNVLNTVNAVNLSANRSYKPHAVNTVNGVNISANRWYNPPPMLWMLWILVQTSHIIPTLWMLWILVQIGHITPHAVNVVNLGTGW